MQTAKLDGNTGVVATVAGKEVNWSLELGKIINVVHVALEGNGEGEETQSENGEGRPEEPDKSDERGVGVSTGV